MDHHGFFNVDQIEVIVLNANNQEHYARPLVKQMDSKIETMRGLSLWSIDLAEQVKAFSQFQWLKDVRINKEWPSKLKISVEFKDVSLLVVSSGENFIPVSSDGSLLPKVSLGNAPDVVTTNEVQIIKNESVRNKLLNAINSLPETGPFSKQSVSKIDYDSKEGVFVYLQQPKLKVKLGHDKFGVKGFRVGQVIQYMIANGKTAESLDADLSNKVILKSQGSDTLRQ